MILFCFFLRSFKDAYKSMGQMACLELAFKYSGKNKCVYVWGMYFGRRVYILGWARVGREANETSLATCWLLKWFGGYFTVLSTLVYV